MRSTASHREHCKVSVEVTISKTYYRIYAYSDLLDVNYFPRMRACVVFARAWNMIGPYVFLYWHSARLANRCYQLAKCDLLSFPLVGDNPAPLSSEPEFKRVSPIQLLMQAHHQFFVHCGYDTKGYCTRQLFESARNLDPKFIKFVVNGKSSHFCY